MRPVLRLRGRISPFCLIMLPREIQAEHWPERTRYDLPRRPIGKVRYLGLLLIGFAVLFAWSSFMTLGRLLRHVAEGGATTGGWLEAAFAMVFVLAALVPFGLGLFILAGRTRLTITRERLISTEIAGPFRKSRRLRVADLERLEVVAAVRQQTDAQPPAAFARLGALAALLRGGQHKLLLLGYPRDWLDALAEELSGQLTLQGKPVTVERVPDKPGGESPAIEEAAQQPAGSNARLVETATSIELTVPSRGLWKDSSGLLFFGLVWCLFIGVFSAAMLFGAKSGKTSGDFGPVGFALMLAVFWAAGLGMMLFGIHLGTRRWTLKADSRRLEVAFRSALRCRQWHWAAAEIKEIGVGDSNVEVNHRRLEELQVRPCVGNKAGLLRGRTHDELAWIATVLRRTLQPRAQPPIETPER